MCRYTLHGVDGVMPNKTGEFISYLLPANRRYSTTFEVKVAGIMDNISIIHSFSKSYVEIKDITLYSTVGPH